MSDCNTLPFRIYSGEETLADQMKKENFKDYENGLYAWDIMEPWAISKFGSNVNGEEESVRVPAYLSVSDCIHSEYKVSEEYFQLRPASTECHTPDIRKFRSRGNACRPDEEREF